MKAQPHPQRLWILALASLLATPAAISLVGRIPWHGGISPFASGFGRTLGVLREGTKSEPPLKAPALHMLVSISFRFAAGASALACQNPTVAACLLRR